jgi:hypothetical protein
MFERQRRNANDLRCDGVNWRGFKGRCKPSLISQILVVPDQLPLYPIFMGMTQKATPSFLSPFLPYCRSNFFLCSYICQSAYASREKGVLPLELMLEATGRSSADERSHTPRVTSIHPLSNAQHMARKRMLTRSAISNQRKLEEYNITHIAVIHIPQLRNPTCPALKWWRAIFRFRSIHC